MPAAKPASRRARPASAGRSVDVARERGINTSSAANAALVDVNKPLTDMQRAFVKLWASGETPLSASIKAGYADNGTYAYRMIRMPNILALYHAEKAAFEQANDMTRKKVMEGLMDGIEMAKMLGEPASVISGWREIGKMCGYYEPITVRHQVTHQGKVMLERMESMSDEELFRLIEERAAVMRQGQLPTPQETEDDGAPA